MANSTPLWLQIALYAGGLFVLNMGLARLWVRDATAQNRLLTALLGTVGVLQVLYALFASGVFHAYPVLMLSHVLPLLAVGPLSLAVVLSFLPENRKPLDLRWHLIPVGLAVLLLLPYYLQDGATKVRWLQQGLPISESPYNAIVVRLFLIGSFASAAIYSGVALARTFFLWKPSTIRRAPHIRMLAGFVALAFFAAFLGLGAQIYAPPYKAVSSLLLSFVFVLAYHVGHRDPNFLSGLRSEIRAARYAQSSLGGLDVEKTILRLESLMREERPFYDEDLSLEELARLVEVRPQQLSEILNVRIGDGFYDYVNRYRVNAAKEQLLNEPGRSVLSIAYAVGFNSRSSFYTCFAKETGMTPSRFRSNGGR